MVEEANYYSAWEGSQKRMRATKNLPFPTPFSGACFSLLSETGGRGDSFAFDEYSLYDSFLDFSPNLQVEAMYERFCSDPVYSQTLACFPFSLLFC